MDMHEFLYMLDEVGVLKVGELRRGDASFKTKSIKDIPAGGPGRIPDIEGLERHLLSKKQATTCFRAGMAQATTQQLIASGELNYDLYKIAAKLVATIYVHGEPESEMPSGKSGSKQAGRASCPPVIPLVPPVQSHAEIYGKILEALPRPRPNGADQTLDEVEELLLDASVFERFCVRDGHSALQSAARRSTMDQVWFVAA